MTVNKKDKVKLKRKYADREETLHSLDTSILLKHKDKLDEIFELYSTVNLLIIQYEVLADTYPAEILNEIRSTFTHLSRCTNKATEEIVLENLSKAKGHMKRAMIDGYKFNSLAFSDEYNNFLNQYKNIDLSFIDNGTFLVNVAKEMDEAKSLMIEAKCCESENNSIDVLYKKYENAYNAYHNVYTMLVEAKSKADILYAKSESLHKEQEKKQTRDKKIDRSIAIIGVIIGILGIVFGMCF